MVRRGRGYGLRFRPPGVCDRIISIQQLSFCLRYSPFSLWIFSITIIFKTSIEWSDREKCTFGHWLLNPSVLDVRSMACQTNAECILRFSDVLNGTSSALNQVYHVTSPTVRGGFHAKLRASCLYILLNIVPVFIWAHVLQHGFLHGLFPL